MEKRDWWVWRASEDKGSKKLLQSGQRPEEMEEGCVRSQGPQQTAVLEEEEEQEEEEEETEEEEKEEEEEEEEAEEEEKEEEEKEEEKDMKQKQQHRSYSSSSSVQTRRVDATQYGSKVPINK